jgi:hypothetical protein
MKFRTVQGLTFGTMLGYWVVRLVTHPNHLHVSMLAMAVLAVVISEVGYRAGKAEKEDSEKELA